MKTKTTRSKPLIIASTAALLGGLTLANSITVKNELTNAVQTIQRVIFTPNPSNYTADSKKVELKADTSNGQVQVEGQVLATHANNATNVLGAGAENSWLYYGKNNKLEGSNSAILYGNENKLKGEQNAVIWWIRNEIGDNTSSKVIIVWGHRNKINWQNSAILGGEYNEIKGNKNLILWGEQKTINGDQNYAFGSYINIQGQNNNFVWWDAERRRGNSIQFTPQASNSFLIRSLNGVGINTNQPQGQGVTVSGMVQLGNEEIPCDATTIWAIKFKERGDSSQRGCFYVCEQTGGSSPQWNPVAFCKGSISNPSVTPDPVPPTPDPVPPTPDPVPPTPDPVPPTPDPVPPTPDPVPVPWNPNNCPDNTIPSPDKTQCLACLESTWNPQTRSCVVKLKCPEGYWQSGSECLVEGECLTTPLSDIWSKLSFQEKLNLQKKEPTIRNYSFDMKSHTWSFEGTRLSQKKPLGENKYWKYVATEPQNPCEYTCLPGYKNTFYMEWAMDCRRPSCLKQEGIRYLYDNPSRVNEPYQILNTTGDVRVQKHSNKPWCFAICKDGYKKDSKGNCSRNTITTGRTGGGVTIITARTGGSTHGSISGSIPTTPKNSQPLLLCEESKQWDSTSKKCVDKCEESKQWDSTSGKCVDKCSDNELWSPSQKQCKLKRFDLVCPTGKHRWETTDGVYCVECLWNEKFNPTTGKCA